MKNLPSLFFGLVLVLSSLTLNAQTPGRSGPSPTPRTSNWSCEMNAFFVGAKAGAVLLTGSGMMSCKNARGFELEQPVSGEIKISGDVKNLSSAEPIRITVQSESFALIRDLNQVYTEFEPQSDSSRTIPDSSSDIVLVSHDRRIVIPMKFSIPEQSLGRWQIDEINFVSTAN